MQRHRLSRTAALAIVAIIILAAFTAEHVRRNTGKHRVAERQGLPEVKREKEQIVVGLKKSDTQMASRRADGKEGQDSFEVYLRKIVRQGDSGLAAVKEMLLRETSPDAAKQLVQAVAKLGTRKAAAALLEAASRTQDKDVSHLIAEIYRNMRTEGAGSALIDAFLGDDPALAKTSASILSNTSDPALIEQLVNSLSNVNSETRAAALDVVRSAFAPECAPLLQQYATGDDVELAKASIGALASQATETGVRLLLDSFGDYPETLVPGSQRYDMVVQEMQHMIAQNPDKPGLRIAIDSYMTTSRDEQTRAAAAAVLQNAASDTDRNIHAMTKALQHEQSPVVRESLMNSIGSQVTLQTGSQNSAR